MYQQPDLEVISEPVIGKCRNGHESVLPSVNMPIAHSMATDLGKCQKCGEPLTFTFMTFSGEAAIDDVPTFLAALEAREGDVRKRQEDDQTDWRKGVALIASALGDQDTNLSCIRISEVALNMRAKLEQAEAEVAHLRSQDGTALTKLQSVIQAFKDGTPLPQPSHGNAIGKHRRAAENRELETIHKTLNVVLEEIKTALQSEQE